MAKEILKDEMLSDEELDNVAGGTTAETVKDTQFLHALGLLDKSYTAAECKKDPNQVLMAIDSAVYKVTGNHWGYAVGANANSANTYSYYANGEDTKQLTREQFLSNICNLAGKPNFDYTPYL